MQLPLEDQSNALTAALRRWSPWVIGGALSMVLFWVDFTHSVGGARRKASGAATCQSVGRRPSAVEGPRRTIYDAPPTASTSPACSPVGRPQLSYRRSPSDRAAVQTVPKGGLAHGRSRLEHCSSGGAAMVAAAGPRQAGGADPAALRTSFFGAIRISWSAPVPARRERLDQRAVGGGRVVRDDAGKRTSRSCAAGVCAKAREGAAVFGRADGVGWSPHSAISAGRVDDFL